jgi:hypothetical protein
LNGNKENGAPFMRNVSSNSEQKKKGAKRMKELENNMVRHQPNWGLVLEREDPLRCDCGEYARLRINGKLRCVECSEDEGVEVL